MRIIIYTGKGGVGKTSVAAATAVRLARLGRRTLVMSTDPAHSLSDSLDVPLKPEPVKVDENLWGLETNVYQDLEKNWGLVREHFAEIMVNQGMSGMLASESAILPGMEELFSLTRIREYRHSDEFDVVVVDAAPTGETLRLLSMPQAMNWLIRFVRGIESTFVRPIVRPIVNATPKLSKYMASERVFKEVDGMFSNLEAIRDILSDGETTTIRIVMNPEKMAIKESKRALTYLSLYGLQVDGVVVNRLLPLGQDSGFLEGWKNIQRKYLTEIEDSFYPLPILRAPMYGTEVVGLERLAALAEDLFGDSDPERRFHTEQPFEMHRSERDCRVRIRLPFLEPEQLETWISGDELVIQIGNQRRMIGLPTSLIGLEPSHAEYLNGWLSICFELPVAAV
jgi:arsenite-transporting ATPase